MRFALHGAALVLALVLTGCAATSMQGSDAPASSTSGNELPKGEKGHFYLLRTFGNSAHEIYDVTEPSKPALLSRIGPLKGTHKNFWECDTGIAYLVSGLDGWRTRRMTQVFDLSDPKNPRFIRNFGLDGQQPGTTGAVPVELHGMISTGKAGN